MNVQKIYLFIIGLSIMLAACSNGDSSDSAEESLSANDQVTTESVNEQAKEQKNGLSETPSSAEKETKNSIIENTEDKMIVYKANIQLETKDYTQFHQTLEKRMNDHKAYMVETNIHKTERGNRQGHIRLRVPQENFQAFVTGIEKYSDQVISKDISGRDVTEEYVDLESRLKAKEKIESRLLTFLDQASATEDLIKISKDLERVQEEIEVIKGRMNYLQNQSDYSTITLSISETKVVVPEIDNQQLNTWEKTKQAFVNSINNLASFFSWITVLLFGYSPILLLISFIIAIFWWVRRRKRSSRND